MSEKQKNYIAVFFRWLVAEIKQGNTTAMLLVVIATYFTWVYVGEPVYNKIRGDIEIQTLATDTNQKLIGDLMMQVQKLQAERDKKESFKELDDAPYGTDIKVGF